MKLSRTVWYALQATVLLAQFGDEAPVPCRRLASVGNMPERFLLQVLRRLVARGILRSARGVDGGYVLCKPADQVALLELIEAIDGPLVPSIPPGDALPARSRARLERVLGHITESARGDLGGITLADLLASSSADVTPPH